MGQQLYDNSYPMTEVAVRFKNHKFAKYLLSVCVMVFRIATSWRRREGLSRQSLSRVLMQQTSSELAKTYLFKEVRYVYILVYYNTLKIYSGTLA